jgi:hypothetical protein
MEQKICELGCGKIAIHQLKSGKWICDTSINRCEVMRKKNSDAIKGVPRYNMRGENHPRGMLGKKSWNSGKTKDNDERLKSMSEKKKGIVPKCAGRAPTDEKEAIRRIRISEKMKLVGGGYRQGSGRGKKGWYKGYWCDSSWELAWVIYQLEHGVKFERNVEKFEYFVNDKKHNYIPDFKIENTYIEIKGYDSDVWQNKLEQFPHKLDILYGNEMEPIFKYVHSKYGKKFVRLYESRDLNLK